MRSTESPRWVVYRRSFIEPERLFSPKEMLVKLWPGAIFGQKQTLKNIY